MESLTSRKITVDAANTMFTVAADVHEQVVELTPTKVNKRLHAKLGVVIPALLVAALKVTVMDPPLLANLALCKTGVGGGANELNTRTLVLTVL